MSTFEQVKEIIVNSLGCDEESVTAEAKVKEDLGADSLSVVELVMALEDDLEITIGEDEMKTLVTVGDVVELIESKK